MKDFIETLSIVLSGVALVFLIFVLLLNFYLIRRNGFYISVNCWFCNTWTKVLYSQRNSFDCPTCLQYNGFEKDGGYNKVIVEQHDTTNFKLSTFKSTKAENGLCSFCSNNQQLKVIQLANFVPLNEQHYDVEIEHFQKQLEKAYKLCRKCDKVLKATIEKQDAWVFGNRIKNFRKKGQSLLDLNSTSMGLSKQVKQSIMLNLVKYTLVLFTCILMLNAIFTKIKYNPFKRSNLKQIPESFIPYGILVTDFYNFIVNQTSSVVDLKNVRVYLPEVVKLQENNMMPLTSVGMFLQVVLMIWDQKPSMVKVNQLLSWTILLLTSWISFQARYFVYINLLQICCSIIQLYTLLSNQSAKHIKKPRKMLFKKLRKNLDYSNLSDVEDADDDLSVSSSKSIASARTTTTNRCKSCTTSAEKPKNPANNRLNNSFCTARSTSNPQSVFNTSPKNTSNETVNRDLNQSLDNLHLGSFTPQTYTTPSFIVNPAISHPKSILTPPKLKNVTQNSWIAGGFWRNEDGLILPISQLSNLSRSSSQSSGFVSQQNEPAHYDQFFNSLPNSRNASVCGDCERNSILSEPAYSFKPISPPAPSNVFMYNSTNNFGFKSTPMQEYPKQLYYRSENTFFPVLNQNNMLYIQGNPHRSTPENRFGGGPFLAEPSFARPVLRQENLGSLFKNLPSSSPSPRFEGRPF